MNTLSDVLKCEESKRSEVQSLSVKYNIFAVEVLSMGQGCRA